MLKVILRLIRPDKNNESKVKFTDCICKLEALEKKLLNLKTEDESN